MKFFIFAAMSLALPALSYADHHDLESRKTTVVSNLDKRIESLNKFKTCVQAAAADDAIKTCRSTHETEMKALQAANLDMKIQKLQEKKAAKQAH